MEEVVGSTIGSERSHDRVGQKLQPGDVIIPWWHGTRHRTVPRNFGDTVPVRCRASQNRTTNRFRFRLGFEKRE